MSDTEEKKDGSGISSPEGEWETRLLNDVDEGLSQIQDRLSDLRHQILSPFEKVEKLAREQNQFGRRLEEIVHKTRSLTYLSLGAALLALVLSGFVLGVHFYLQGTADRLQAQVAGMGSDLLDLRKDLPTAEIREFQHALDQNDKMIDALSDRLGQWQQDQKSRARRLTQANGRMKTQVKRIETQVAALGEQLEGIQTQLRVLEAQKKAVAPVQPPPEWFVNLISFTKEGYARKVARSYDRRGVPAKVKAVRVKGRIWYRLYVPGFPSQEAAETYARRVEKALRLGSVWISRN